MGVGGVEQSSTAGAVTVQTGPVSFVELDRGNPENSKSKVKKQHKNML